MRERRAPWSSSERCVRRGLEKLCYIKETGVTFLSTLGTQYNHTNKEAWSKKKTISSESGSCVGGLVQHHE